MARITRNTLLFLILGALFALHFSLPAMAAEMDDLFSARKWDAMDVLMAERGGDLTARELSLAANALWLRGKWAPALELLQKTAPHWPEEVKPYGELMTVLALERTGEKKAAAEKALKLLPKAPADTAYYLAYALYRLTDEKDGGGRKKHLEKMYALARNDQQKTSALSLLLALPGEKTAHALAMTALSPRNSAALKVLEALPKPWSVKVNYALGYAAYLQGRHDKAIPLLKAVPLDSANGRKARYYRALSLYSTKKYGEALELWSILGRKGTTYAESSILRISILAERAQRDRALRVLREIAADRDGAISARAYYSLSTHATGQEKRDYEEKVIALIPNSLFTTRILYERGRDLWKKGDVKGAVSEWERSISDGMDGNWRARILYWTAKGYDRLGEGAKKETTVKNLLKNHPLSIYAFLSGGDKLTIIPQIPPYLGGGKPSELEQWGFITYARWELLARGDPKSLFRAARLAEWSGDQGGAYSAMGRLYGQVTKGPEFFRKAMEYLYPRPYLEEVRRAAKRFEVEENLVWAIMRQESAFKPNATSWVGAAGLMQLMPATARGEANALKMKKYSLYTPADNITLGAAHIARLLKSFTAVEQAVAAYNGGGGSARRWLGDRKDVPLDEWIEMVRFEETNDYVRKVMANLHIYRQLYGPSAPLSEDGEPEEPENKITPLLDDGGE